MRTRLACLALAALAAPALAQPAEPGPPPPAMELRAPPPPPTVVVQKGDPVASAHVSRLSYGLSNCLATGAQVQTTIRLRWDAKGRPGSISVRGGSAGFARCVRKALKAPVPIVRRRAGAGSVVVLIRGTAAPTRSLPAPVEPAPEPVPVPIATPDALHACKVDTDCVLHFRQHACVPGDPVAVNGRDMKRVLATYPVQHIACGMGGPQYDRLRRESEHRYATRCEQARCTLVDHGARPTGPMPGEF